MAPPGPAALRRQSPHLNQTLPAPEAGAPRSAAEPSDVQTQLSALCRQGCARAVGSSSETTPQLWTPETLSFWARSQQLKLGSLRLTNL